MKNFMKIMICTALIVFAASCKKTVLNETPPALLTADNLFVDYNGFQNAVNGLYYQVRRYRAGITTSDPSNDITSEVTVEGVDNSYSNYPGSPGTVYNNWGAQNNASFSEYSSLWAYFYQTINAANTIIGRVATNTTMTADQKNQTLAESRLIRAWCYRHLTYLFGDVPLVLTETTGANFKTDFTRNSVADVQAAMEADWLFAEANLPVTNANDGKVIKGTAQHYLAELYLTQGNFTKAKDYATRVTTNASYALISARYGPYAKNPGTPFTDMFLDGNSDRSQGNTEALWVLQNEINVTGGEGNNIMRRYWVNRYYSLTVKGTDGKATSPFLVSSDFGGRGIGRIGPTKWALSIYDPTDDRGSDFAWRSSYAINNPAGIPKGDVLGQVIPVDRTSNEKLSNPNWPSTRKWDYTSPLDVNNSSSYNDQILIRSGEDYLFLAEADFGLNDLGGAATAINALRTRAHAPQVIASQITLDFILDERSRELFAEEDRRYTLTRTNTWLARTKLHNVISGPLIQPRDQLLPIPQSVIDANINKVLPQNPGY
jgi:hypothetical protein